MDQDPPTFDDAELERLFGVRAVPERTWVRTVVAAVERLDRGLLPPPAAHPRASLIARGAAAVPALLDEVDAGDDRAKRVALDALAHILAITPQPDAIARLKRALAAARDVELAALLEKTIAIARDEATLREQMRRLTDDDPAVVASAARLVGLGRYAPAVPVLKALVSPERIYESRWVIWALGEIGDAAALPALEIALAHAFRVMDCLIAIGKIGRVTSIPQLTPHIVGGIAEQKDAAVRALAMILDKSRSDASAIAPLRAQLAGLLERELADAAAPLSGSTRFHMLLCLARLGHKLDEARVKKYLGGTLAPASGRNAAALRVRPTKTTRTTAKSPRRPLGPR